MFFSSHLARSNTLSYSAIKAFWSGLTDARLAQYDAILSDEWSAVRPHLGEAMEHLRKIHDTIDPCLTVPSAQKKILAAGSFARAHSAKQFSRMLGA
jgi:hypothetical protein